MADTQRQPLEQRRIPFAFPNDIEPVWIPGQPELTAMINGGSLTMPYLEPFLIRTMREAAALVPSESLRTDALEFNAQEGQHFRAHRRFNDLIKAQRYPELAAVEAAMSESYARLDQRSLRTRMAYTAGFESMTLGVTRWLIENRHRLFLGADSRVASFVLWHMVEETEHKRVAYEVYQQLFGGSLRGYLARMIGVFHGSLDVMRFSMRGYKAILRKDGRWSNLRSRLRLARHLADFTLNVGPYLLRAALPGHTPCAEKDPQWALDWLAAYPHAEDGHVPLIDTAHPDMPIPFPATRQPA
jgi:predicted metal-dependent hydrolase